MATKKSRCKRKNTLKILLLPALIFVFFMGWCMYWAGDKKDQKHLNRKVPNKDNVTLLPAIFEETERTIVEQ